MKTALTERLGIELPIIQAPMGGVVGPGMAAAVSNAGGLGMLVPWAAKLETVRRQIRETRALTSRPFGVNLVIEFPQEERLEVCLEERVPIVSFFWGDPTRLTARAKAGGAIVLHTVGSAAEAKGAVDAGVDIVVAQGWEAGGHVRGTVATLPLVPTVVDAVAPVPVVAAGGIADGRGLAAVLMLGAEGAWLGTRFVASREWAGGEWAKERVVAATADDTVLTHAYDLATAAPFPAGIGDRVLRNDYTATWHERDGEVVAHREELVTQLRAAQQAGDARVAAVRAGNAASLIDAVEPAGEIVRRIVAEAERVLRERLGRVVRAWEGGSVGVRENPGG